MFPGGQRPTYNNAEQANYNRPQMIPPGTPPQYGRPDGLPPRNYDRPDGPPQYGRPDGPPPRNYDRPDGPPQYGRPDGPPPRNYDRPDVPPPNQGYGNNAPEQYIRPAAPPPPQSMQHISGSNIPFQYSQMTGRRKALLIGINYIGTQNELRGCINDSKNIHNFLTSRYGYAPEDIVILNDDQADPVRRPTRANIIRAMQWLVSNAQPNDALFFHYSGHGGQVQDQDGDEEDGMDDCIYPLDFQQAGPIIDDEMHDIMVKPLQPGVRLTALFDSCHSGTALDLPYTYSTKGLIKEPSILKDVGADGLQAVMSYATGNIGGMIASATDIFSRVTKSQSVNREEIIKAKFSPADVIMMSGSKDNQTSADAVENGMATGAMSYAFVKVLSQQPQQSYLSLLQNMRYEMQGKYTQKPQLSSSHPIDVNLQLLL